MESFNARLRDELLDGELFYSLREAEIIIESWRQHYNTIRPHGSLGFGNWFRDRCNEAKLPHCSAHGLRKAAARRLAEAGCGNQQIKAITGHKTDKEVGRYTAAADQKRLAEQAMAAAYGTDEEQELSNRPDELDKTADNVLKDKG